MKTNLFLKLKGMYLTMPRFLQKPVYDVLYSRDIKKSMKVFLTKEELSDKQLTRELVKDIQACRKLYKTKPDEYFLYGFRGMLAEQRATFLPDMVKDTVLKERVGFDVFSRELRNKFNFYKLAGKWFGREAFLVGPKQSDLASFLTFCKKHPDLFVKSNALSKGRGVGLYHLSNDQEAEALYAKLKKEGSEWIVEERIVQAPEMAQWNASSVNTVRIPSVLYQDKWAVIGPVFRSGRKGSVVDNAGAGGIITCIDPKTGILTTDGVDEAGVYYAKHPDSGLVFKGWQIPKWQELLKLAEEIQRSMPHHQYVGWDFALTEHGWVLIEGNWGQFLTQYNDHIGLKKQFFTLMGVEE